MLRLLVGLALLPLSASLSWVGAKTLAGVAVASAGAAPFAAGLGLSLAGWLVARFAVVDPLGPVGWGVRMARWTYVLGHEMTHALAAWALGGSVYGIKVAEDGGHVDLSHSNAFIALAPYCVPLYVFAVALGYRAVLWLRPDFAGEALFLGLMGAALAFHLLLTWDALTQSTQPDLKAAGGVVFSWAVIAAVNGAVVLVLLKALFPDSVGLLARFKESGRIAFWAWSGAWAAGKPAAVEAWRRFGS
ncbi:MAG: hypothetical protein SF051_05690 [Elusimicrobiota bacterium]|nr:hypothetical protein [Elusimicrobiota bacterium]